ncbi:class I SAM-dependent methyltransferase [Burkholderia alba]|uniref:class I SAM-dependent methyltransferase n=1 Tax=Burkholderia alba TaxID=2683677 RepID=UPI002B0607CE|nr:class I SAM-dependent methyltransferase [Burkholderia alba]
MASLTDMAVCEVTSLCKCCAGPSRLCGVVDFSRSCNDRPGAKVAPCAGVPVYYHRCEQCGFVFTRAFDGWSYDDFSAYIYNDDYVRHDPDYLGSRPAYNAEIVAGNFPDLSGKDILDYGSGLGLLEKNLKNRGFGSVDSYDPIAGGTARPDRRYDVVIAFEVFEHHPAPLALIDEVAGFLRDDGVILFSTTLVTEAVLNEGIERWWYCAPSNGHISFFTPQALARVGAPHGLTPASFTEGIHFFFRNRPPEWALRFSHQVWAA